ncbi:MAG: TPM domain-containing protein [Sphingomonadaceae bacterium]
MGCAAKGDAPPPPALELTGRVVDAADIIATPVEAQLTSQLEQLEADTGVQLVVATTPSLEGKDILVYSVDLARAWGIGDAKRNDGLMLLVAPNEREVRIEVGYGLESTVKDEEADEILQQAVLPEFRKGSFERGIMQGVDRLILEVTPAEMKEAA